MVREQLDSDLVTLYGMQVGLVKPNMRSEVMRILGEVRLTIAAIFVVLVTILTLISTMQLLSLPSASGAGTTSTSGRSGAGWKQHCRICTAAAQVPSSFGE